MRATSSTSATSTDHLEALERDECVLRLQARGLGRVGATLRGRPIVYPVNYALHDGAILFRTRRGGDLDASTLDRWAAFEIDDADNLYHEGWSVLVVGRASHVTDPSELASLTFVPLTPWADDDRHLVVRIPLHEVTGRHIHHRAGALESDVTLGPNVGSHTTVTEQHLSVADRSTSVRPPRSA